jgi:drug/metabolite transporter (DMT)-like permease
VVTQRQASASNRWATHAALLLVQIAFASQAVEAKIAMAPRDSGGEGISPWAVAMVRMIGAALFFQLFTRATGALRETTWKDRGRLCVLSILGIVLNQSLFLVGLRLTSPMTASLLSVTIPVFSAALAVAAAQERATIRLGAGLALSIAGVVSLTGLHQVDYGALVVLGNCLSYAAYIVYSRETIRRLGALTVITWIFSAGALLFAPLGLPSLVAGVAEWTPRGWAFLTYIVLVPTIVAYLANAWALGRSTATLVTVYIYMQPALTAALAWVQRGDRLTERLAWASLLIVAGVSVVATRREAQPVPVQEE